jgi:hypothetical protein
MYRKAGYRPVREQPDEPGIVQLSKRVRR